MSCNIQEQYTRAQKALRLNGGYVRANKALKPCSIAPFSSDM
jgi:hypothetical protein